MADLLLDQVLAVGFVAEWEEFLSADALSAWMVLLISAVSLGSSLYAGRYFHRDLAAGVVTAEVGQTSALKDAALAHRDLESRRTVGATLLLP